MGDAGGLADLGEGPGLMEPLLIREAAPQRGQLLDLVVELVGAAGPPDSGAVCRRGCRWRWSIWCGP